MKDKIIDFLVCLKCRGILKLLSPVYDKGEIKSGRLYCSCGENYIIKDYIPRFVPNDSYVDSFSFEWNKHRTTQLDSANKNLESEKRFSQSIDFPLDNLKDKLVLDAGCGMGRFAEIVLKYSGTVVGIDLSLAVEAAFKNMGFHKNAHFIQADIFNLPFKQETFNFIYSFGALHHTPDCRMAFKQLPPLLKKGGKLSISVYSSYNKAIVYSSNFWRLITTRLPKRLVYYFSFISVVLYYLYRIPIIGHIGKAIFVIPMWSDWRWRVLDTFDWYSPKYQSKHTHWEVFGWFKENGLRDINIYPNEVTISGVK